MFNKEIIHSIKLGVLDYKNILNHYSGDIAILFHMTKLPSDIFYPQKRDVGFHSYMTKHFIKLIFNYGLTFPSL